MCSYACKSQLGKCNISKYCGAKEQIITLKSMLIRPSWKKRSRLLLQHHPRATTKTLFFPTRFGRCGIPAPMLSLSPGDGAPQHGRLPRVHDRGSGLSCPGRGGGLPSLCPGALRRNCHCRSHPGRLFSSCRLCSCSVCPPLLQDCGRTV